MNVLREQWNAFVDTFANLAFGWDNSETAEQYARLTREAITQEGMLRLVGEADRIDVRDDARAIRTPTLVIVRREVGWGLLDQARALAGLIPGARLLVLDGGAPAPFLGDTETVVRAFLEFLASEEQPRAAVTPRAALSARETQVLRLLAGGSTSKEIAAALGISVSTAQRHVANIYSKIGARGRVEAAAYAFSRGMLKPEA
jgi:DNA-binding CsgD family transcriptional regulator